MPVIFIVRGLPGAGKSTMATTLAADAVSADDYFMQGGVYKFDPSLLPAAHAACQERARQVLASGRPVAVANTFTQGWEIQPYVKIAEEMGARMIITDLFDGNLSDEALANRNVHSVPVEAIRAMRARWERDWQKADPRPPWERG